MKINRDYRIDENLFKHWVRTIWAFDTTLLQKTRMLRVLERVAMTEQHDPDTMHGAYEGFRGAIMPRNLFVKIFKTLGEAERCKKYLLNQHLLYTDDHYLYGNVAKQRGGSHAKGYCINWTAHTEAGYRAGAERTYIYAGSRVERDMALYREARRLGRKSNGKLLLYTTLEDGSPLYVKDVDKLEKMIFATRDTKWTVNRSYFDKSLDRDAPDSILERRTGKRGVITQILKGLALQGDDYWKENRKYGMPEAVGKKWLTGFFRGKRGGFLAEIDLPCAQLITFSLAQWSDCTDPRQREVWRKLITGYVDGTLKRGHFKRYEGYYSDIGTGVGAEAASRMEATKHDFYIRMAGWVGGLFGFEQIAPGCNEGLFHAKNVYNGHGGEMTVKAVRNMMKRAFSEWCNLWGDKWTEIEYYAKGGTYQMRHLKDSRHYEVDKTTYNKQRHARLIMAIDAVMEKKLGPFHRAVSALRETKGGFTSYEFCGERALIDAMMEHFDKLDGGKATLMRRHDSFLVYGGEGSRELADGFYAKTAEAFKDRVFVATLKEKLVEYRGNMTVKIEKIEQRPTEEEIRARIYKENTIPRPPSITPEMIARWNREIYGERPKSTMTLKDLLEYEKHPERFERDEETGLLRRRSTPTNETQRQQQQRQRQYESGLLAELKALGA